MKKLSIPITAGLIVTALCGCKDADTTKTAPFTPETTNEANQASNTTLVALKTKLTQLKELGTKAKRAMIASCYAPAMPEEAIVDPNATIICTSCGNKTSYIAKESKELYIGAWYHYEISLLNKIAKEQSLDLLFSLDNSDFCASCGPKNTIIRRYKVVTTYTATHSKVPSTSILYEQPSDLDIIREFLSFNVQSFDPEKDAFDWSYFNKESFKTISDALNLEQPEDANPSSP